MPKFIKTITNLGIDYSLLSSFNASDSATTISPSYAYDVSESNLKLWVDFTATSPTDRSNNGDPASDIDTFVYEGSPEISTDTIGSKTYNFARFDDGENTNALLTYDNFENSISFGGSSDSAFSISLWYYRDSSRADGSEENLLTKGNGADAGSPKEYQLKFASGGGGILHFRLFDSDNSNAEIYVNKQSLGSTYFDDAWNHIVITYNGLGSANGISLFLNGVEASWDYKSTSPSYVSMRHASKLLYIGGNENGTVEGDGRYAELAILSSKLSLEQIQAIYYGTQFGAYTIEDILRSGYLNNPARTIIKDLDNRTGTYPTVHRMNRKDNAGILSNVRFDDTQTLIFGNRIYDDFKIEEPGLANKFVNGNLWEVSTNGVRVKKDLADKKLNEITNGAVVLGGAASGGGRWLKTKSKIALPTVYATLLQGPLNNESESDSKGSLRLFPGEATDVLKLQASTDGTIWTDIPFVAANIASGVSTVFIDDNGALKPRNFQFNGTSIINAAGQETPLAETDILGVTEQPAVTIKIGMDAFSEAGFNEPFYIRFLQDSISNDRQPVWAIGKIEIISRDQQVTYPHLHPVGDTAGEAHLNQIIATPNITSSIVSSGSAISWASSANYLPVFNEQQNSPFNEDIVVEVTNNNFYNRGTLSSVTPGFDSRLLDKTKFTLVLSTSQETKIGAVTPSPVGTNTSYQDMMCYYNFSENKWDVGPLRGPRRYDIDAVDQFMSAAIGFGSLNDVGESKTTELSVPTRYPNFNYNPQSYIISSVRPTNAFGFPSHVRYAPQTGSVQTIKASSLGITKPFLLEKLRVKFDASMRFADLEDANAAQKEAYKLRGLKWSGSNFGDFGKSDMQFYIPTFFILRDFKDSIRYQNLSNKIDITVGASIDNINTSIVVPDDRYIFPASTFNDKVFTNRELVTYGQFTIFRSGSKEESGYINIPGSSDNFHFLDTDEGDQIINSLTRDAKLIVLSSSVNTYDLDQFQIDFSCKSPIISEKVFSIARNSKTGTDEIIIMDSKGGKTPSPINGSSRNISSPFNPDLNAISSFNVNIGDGLTSELNILAEDISIDSFNRPAPYLILPEDDLIFGWQYPTPRELQAGTAGSSTIDDENSMTLKGITKIEFFGSQIKDGKEFHEGLNQNLTSNSVHEIIGSEPVVDQWQIATRGEMTGSFIDQFVYAYDVYSPITTEKGYRIGSIITPPSDDITTKSVQNLLIKGNIPENRIASEESFLLWDGITVGGSRNTFSILNTKTETFAFSLLPQPQTIHDIDSIGTSRSDGKTGGRFIPQIQRFFSTTDIARVFKDSKIDNVNQSETYGSYQNYTFFGTGGNIAKLGGSPKYYFNIKHYGHIADNIRQGLDGRFDSRETAVLTKFVKSNYDLKNGEFRTFSLIKPSDVDGTSYDTYQSSNISLFATSSLPFFDDNTVRNRTYGDSFIGVS